MKKTELSMITIVNHIDDKIAIKINTDHFIAVWDSNTIVPSIGSYFLALVTYQNSTIIIKPYDPTSSSSIPVNIIL